MWFIYGTPTQVTTSSTNTFLMTVTDSAAGSDTELVTLNIGAASAGNTTSIVQSFNGTNGSGPNAIIQAADGLLYGTTSAGGSTLGSGKCLDANGNDIGCGTVFRINSDHSISVLASFAGGTGGSAPTGLIQGIDGNFYGTTLLGGTTINQTTGYSCATFDSNLNPTNVGCGTIFQVTPAGALQTIASFQGAINSIEQGSFPNPLILGANGVIYGTTGACNNPLGSSSPSTSCDPTFGTIFEFTTPTSNSNSVEPTVLYRFPNTLAYPNSLVVGTDNSLPSGANTVLYGTTQITDDSGEGCQQFAGCGALFEYIFPTGSATSGTVETLFDFTLTGAEYGNLNSQTGASSSSTAPIVRARHQGLIRQPSRGMPTGGTPWFFDSVSSSLTQASDGSLWGTTPTQMQFGSSTTNGTPTEGTVFHYLPPTGGATAGTLDTVSLSDWSNGLTLGSDGNYYGMADSGVFEISSSPTASTPVSLYGQLTTETGNAMIQGADGNFYGTSTDSANGAVFEVTSKPVLAGPVTLSFPASSIMVNTATQLSWSVSNAFSVTMQQCYASVQQGAQGAGTWTGQQSGTITGGKYSGSATITPTAAGKYTYALTCGGVETGSTTLMVTVPSLTITSATLPNADQNAPYTTTLTASGGVSPYSWSLASGSSYPAGLTMSSAGVLSGTPTGSGTIQFSVQVSDSESTPQVKTGQVSIQILQPMVSAGPTTIIIAAPGDSGSTTLTLSNFAAATPSFSCKGLPAESSCSETNVTNTSATLTINTTAPSTAMLERRGAKARLLYALLLPGLLLLAPCLGARKRGYRILPSLLIFAAISFAIGCGGGGGTGTKTTDPGTPVGTTSATVTATLGSQTVALPITVTVQ
jgi:hypothetical protein